MSPFQIALSLGQRVHTTRVRTFRGRGGLVPILPKEGSSSQKCLLQKLYLRFPREMDFSVLHGSIQEP